MNIANKKTLAVFFTRNISLSKWQDIGILDREIGIYFELGKYFEKITLFTYGDKRDFEIAKNFPKNIKVITGNNILGATLYSFLLPFIHRKLLKDIDILKTNQMDGSWSAVITKKLFRKKLIIRCGYEWLSFIEKGKGRWWKKAVAKMVEKIAYKNADKISITSADDRDFIVERFDVSPEKVHIIPNYIDTQKFKPLYISKEKGRVLFLGRFEDQKNLHSLVIGMSGIEGKLFMIGGGSQREYLENLAKENNVSIEFLGNISQDNIPEELNKSEIFILPSFYEGNPKALLEAMSCGVPCVGSKAPGISNIITDEVDGVLCGLEPESIKQTIKRVLDDKSLSITISAGARNTILNTFSFEKVLEKEINLYKSLYEKNI